MKRLIYLSKEDLTVKIQTSTGISAFPAYHPVFTLSKKGDSFTLSLSPALAGKYDITPDSSPHDSALAIVTELTRKEDSEMHKLINQFAKGYEPASAFTVEYTSAGAVIPNNELEFKNNEAPASGVR
ncbi:hypothetical protein [Legionella sp. km772]|uniref:hypothetical protein n=1 Tax=Legionella sp. km772 TaxID=2498111 RepID=UPI000F8D1805|nr:hypothetical protein [Legionella sp. km772]RUR12937.1 hypothetical protein ELY15_03660 [Legionella sp. km772]